MQESFIHSGNSLLYIVHPFWVNHSCKNLVYIIEQNKDFDPNRAYVLVDEIREVKMRKI